MEASSAPRKAKQKGPYLDFSRLNRSEYVGMAGAGVLLISLFLPWFATSDSNPNSKIEGKTGDFTAFEVFGTLQFWLMAACLAPFILAWIIARGHKLTWRPGEVTMIVGITAFALIIMNGIILGKPGDSVDIGFKYGYLVGILGALMICASGVVRQSEGGRERKVPGQI